MTRRLFISILSVYLFSLQVLAASNFVQESYFIYDNDREHISFFKKYPELTIDHPNSEGFELYGPQGLGLWLEKLNIQYSVLPRPSFQDLQKKQKGLATYPNFLEVEQKLKELQEQYPKLIKLFSVGKSHEGKDLWVVKISDNPEVDEIEPEVKYIANMHGDEIVGRELMLRLIAELVQGYEKNERIKNLIDNTEIFIMPSMNPDGSDRRQRGNNKQVDLNRNFPDFTTSDDQNNPENREPETKAIMAFQAQRNFALSANFHGGAVCVNYPWDTQAERFPFYDLVVALSLEYAAEVPEMKNSYFFKDGITNGYQWYEVDGGMQDWSYHWYNDLQVTVELSGQKWPNYSKVSEYYQDNHESLLKYLERVHQGTGFTFEDATVKGRVEIIRTDTKKPLNLGSFGFENGEFYKVLSEGEYEFHITTDSKNYFFHSEVRYEGPKNNGDYVEIKFF